MAVRTIERGRGIMLRQAGNGGWIVYQEGRIGEFGASIGAYTTAQDMLAALGTLLEDQPVPFSTQPVEQSETEGKR